MNLLFRRLGPAFKHPYKRPNPTSAKGRWCKLAIAPPLHILNKTSPNLLEYLVMLPSTHVQNLARCSVVWNAKTPFLVFLTKKFPALYSNSCVVLVFDRTFSYCSRRAPLFKVLLASLEDIYPNSAIKWPGRIGAQPIPDKYMCVCFNTISETVSNCIYTS